MEQEEINARPHEVPLIFSSVINSISDMPAAIQLERISLNLSYLKIDGKPRMVQSIEVGVE